MRPPITPQIGLVLLTYLSYINRISMSLSPLVLALRIKDHRLSNFSEQHMIWCWCSIMKCYFWKSFAIHFFFILLSAVQKWMMQSGIIQSRGPSIMRAGSLYFPQPLTPTRQQYPIRYSIIPKLLFPAFSILTDEMSSVFTGQLLHHSALLWKKNLC